jgi:hypothetical protein
MNLNKSANGKTDMEVLPFLDKYDQNPQARCNAVIP